MLRTHDQVFTTNTRPIEMDNPTTWKRNSEYELWVDELWIDEIETLHEHTIGERK